MGTPIGQIIRQARLAAGLTLEDVATRVGVTPGALSHIESGRRLPYPQNAARIAEVLGLPAEEILSALDEAHSDRRQSAAYESMEMSRAPRASQPRAYREQPIRALFDGLNEPRMNSLTPGFSLRQSARWSDDSSERLQALDGLAGKAAEAIRTLRGLLDDEDPTVAREARRLLRELDVQLPEE